MNFLREKKICFAEKYKIMKNPDIRNFFIGVCFVLLSAFSCLGTALRSEAAELPGPSSAGALQVQNGQLCDMRGDPVQLKGISTHGLAWFPQYVNADAFSTIRKDWHMNVVRLALYTEEYGGYCAGGDRNKLLQLIDDGIRYATEADLYVIVDWHILSDGNPNTHLSEAKEFFSTLSQKYKDSSNLIYEICNEPNGGTPWKDIKNYAEALIPVIRANDPDALILIGTPNWSQYVDQAAADPVAGYDNLMYTLHYYAATHKEDLRNKLRDAVKAGLPVFVSEYGICDASGSGGIDYPEARAWSSLLDELKISSVSWNLSNKQETSAFLKPSCQKTGGFTTDDLSEGGRFVVGGIADTVKSR